MLLSLIPLVLLLIFIFDTFLDSYPTFFSQDIFTVLSIFNDNLSPEMFEKLGISKKKQAVRSVYSVS